MAKCFSCGTTEAETWRFCSSRKEFVCLACEKICANYSRQVLPNGCNCRLTYIPEDYYKYLCNTDKYKEYYRRYESFNNLQLRGLFKSVKESYAESNDVEARVDMRAKLAALKALIDERVRIATIRSQ